MTEKIIIQHKSSNTALQIYTSIIIMTVYKMSLICKSGVAQGTQNKKKHLSGNICSTSSQLYSNWSCMLLYLMSKNTITYKTNVNNCILLAWPSSCQLGQHLSWTAVAPDTAQIGPSFPPREPTVEPSLLPETEAVEDTMTYRYVWLECQYNISRQQEKCWLGSFNPVTAMTLNCTSSWQKYLTICSVATYKHLTDK